MRRRSRWWTKPRAAEDPLSIAINRGNEGLAALGIGADQRATAAFVEQLRLFQEFAYFESVYEGLIGLAAVAARRGAIHQGGLLAGAGQAAFDRRAHYPADKRIIERIRAECLEPARTMAAEAWDAAMREGRALDERQAISAALRIAEPGLEQMASL